MANIGVRDFSTSTGNFRPSAPSSSPLASLKPFFRKKLNRGISDQNTPCSTGTAEPQATNSAAPNEGHDHNGVLRRGRSTTWSGEKLSKSTFTKQNTIDPPSKEPRPFAEAYRHAILHAKLEVASAASDADRTRALLGRYSPAIGTTSASSPLLGSGSRRRADSGLFPLTGKSIILTDDGCILQYSNEGPSNRLPEKILQLGPASTAVASDAIRGRHWVLSIVRNSRDASSESSYVAKSPRTSRLSRSSTNGKIHVMSLLVAFSDDSTFNNWLVAVRTEIEAVGGLEYHPDSIQTMRPCGSHTEPTVDGPQLPSAPYIGPLSSPEKSPAPLQAGLVANLSPKSTAESSIGTITDLDKLRNSTLLDSRSFKSGGTSVSAESDTEASCTAYKSTSSATNTVVVDEDPKMLKSKRNKKPTGLRPIIVEPRGHRRSTSCSPSLGSPQFPRTPTLALDAVDRMAGAFQKHPTPLTPGAQYSPGQAPFAFLKLIQNVSLYQHPQSIATDEELCRPDSGRSQDAWNGDVCDAETRDELVQEWTQPRSSAGTEHPPPPPYSLTPQRRSSLKSSERSMSRGASGLGILDISPPRISGVYSSLSSPDLPTPTDLSSSTASPTGDFGWLDGKIWVPPRADRSRGCRSSTRQSPHKHRQDKSSINTELHDQSQPRCNSSNFRLRTPRCDASSSANSLRQQRSMPSLRHIAALPTAPPPSGPLPAVPTSLATAKPHRPEQQRAPSLPLLQTKFPSSSTTRQARAATINSPASPQSDIPSPLSSNPISPRERKHARRLSAVNGFPAIDFEFSSNQPWPPKETELEPESEIYTAATMKPLPPPPPPSSWETWRNAFNNIEHTAPRSRPDSGIYRAGSSSRASSAAEEEEQGGCSERSWIDDDGQIRQYQQQQRGSSGGSMVEMEQFRFPFS